MSTRPHFGDPLSKELVEDALGRLAISPLFSPEGPQTPIEQDIWICLYAARQWSNGAQSELTSQHIKWLEKRLDFEMSLVDKLFEKVLSRKKKSK